MTLNQLSKYFNDFLHLENFSADVSRNGVQVQNSSPDSKKIKKIAFAVDASLETAQKAVEAGADLLFVHHGMFWGGCDPIVGNIYDRYSTFIKNDLALYASHIPLDANNPYGNNYGLASRIGLVNLEPFGEWRGMMCGVKGKLFKPASIEQLTQMVMMPGEKPMAVLPFGKKEICTVGIVSGGGGEDFAQAVDQGLDLYITGEVGHSDYHYIKECGLNMIAMGHYYSETVGVQLVMKKVQDELGLETVFIDVPTEL